MNYQNIENEIKKYSEFFKLSQNSISKLTTYYKEVGKGGTKFIDKIKQYLDEFYYEVSKENRNTSYNKYLLNIYSKKKNFLEKMRIYFINIEKNYGDKFAEFEKDYKNKNKDFISKLNAMNTSLSNEKLQLDKWKTQYFDLCKESVNIENKIKTLQNNQDKKDALNKLQSQLKINKELKESKKNDYKIHQENLNKLMNFFENNYFKLINEIENKDIEKMKYINKLINDCNQLLVLFMKDLNEYLHEIDSLKKTLNAKSDWKTLRNEFNFNVENDINKEKRFILEDFLDYDTIKKEDNLNNINNENNNINNDNNSNIILIKDENDEKFKRIKKILKLGKLFFIDLNKLNVEEQQLNNIIINIITNENKINNEDFLKVINFVENNGEHCSKFMDILITHFCKDKFIIFKNYDNFQQLINILVFILNYIYDQKNFFDICFLIIFIAEKSGYFGLEQAQSPSPIYFFEILSQKTIFKSTYFWKQLIDAKIDMISQIDINKEYNKRMKNTINKNNLFGNFFSTNDNLESELMLKQIFREKIGVYFIEVFYSFLKHFMNFNFYEQEEILNSFNDKYNLDKTSVDYFKSVIKSNNIFNSQQKSIKNIKSTNKILFDYKPNKSFKKIENKSIKCLLFSLKYLTKSEYISILCLNKKYYKPILFTIYKEFLLKKENLSIKNHVMIWKILLNYREIKKEYDYSKILESIKDGKKEIIREPLIKADIERTNFHKNKEENKIKLLNILKAISSEFPKINYFQGMNRIGAFLLNICDYIEEDSFYLFVGILKCTDYCPLFENDLKKMNSLFYVFDRLLNLYLPGIYNYFNQNSINASFFLSSWLITLCTNVFDDSDEKNNAKSIMLIWDLFFYSGWKTFMKVGLIILKQREKEILENSPEHLLTFLTGNVIKSKIIEEKHFEQFKEEMLSVKFNIKKELIENIGEEYEVRKNIEFFNTKNKVNCAY